MVHCVQYMCQSSALAKHDLVFRYIASFQIRIPSKVTEVEIRKSRTICYFLSHPAKKI